MYGMIEPWIIEKIEEERRRRETPAQVPLYDEVREIPPGWEPDPVNGGYRRKEDRRDDSNRDRGVVIIEF